MSSGNLKADLQTGLTSVAKEWKKAKKREDRISRGALTRMRYAPARTSIRDAAFDVMEDAYNKASSNGKYITHSRQIMYVARPMVLRITGGAIWKTSSYFTQTLLKDYLELYRPDWKIVWDARGHLKEPHTGHSVDLGGIGVMKYQSEWTGTYFPVAPIATIDRQIETEGPTLRYGAALFIEKEGFTEILTHAGLANRYDLAIFSSKGVPTGAACQMARMLNEADVPVFVAHDLDLAGFKILRTLRRGTRLQPGAEVIDIGFRLEDVEGLESEPVTYEQRRDPKAYLRTCGATEAEAEFLVSRGDSWGGWSGQRVELNAMTSEQFIEWLESKLEAHGVKKIIPDSDTLADAYRRGVFRSELEKVAASLKDELPDIDVPADLEDRVREHLEESPRTPWDEAVSLLAEEDQEEADDA